MSMQTSLSQTEPPARMYCRCAIPSSKPLSFANSWNHLTMSNRVLSCSRFCSSTPWVALMPNLMRSFLTIWICVLLMHTPSLNREFNYSSVLNSLEMSAYLEKSKNTIGLNRTDFEGLDNLSCFIDCILSFSFSFSLKLLSLLNSLYSFNKSLVLGFGVLFGLLNKLFLSLSFS